MIQTSFFDNYLFVHTHIEKCGGSSLLRYLYTLFGREDVFDLRPFPTGISLKVYGEIQKRKRHLKVLSSHLWYNEKWSQFIPKNHWSSRFISPILTPYTRKQALYIASVRHPIDRLNSLFRFLKTRTKHELYHPTIANNNFDGFIQHLAINTPFKIKNEMCAQISGQRRVYGQALFEYAKQAFDQHYFAIVPYNKTHELANLLADVFQLPRVQEHVINSSATGEKPIPSAETITLLEEKCREDILLYEYVIKNYQEKLIHAKKYLEALCGK